ncbi:MAG TPA: glutathione S-transferase family protein [Parvularculaceae bacterium]|nr:glutathione S-transferase family protein [Parvularculaceae bacterium]
MLILHDYPASLNGWKAHVLLGLLGLDYEVRPVAIFSGESRTAEFLEKNPAGAIPVLELEDGRTLAESNAILCYLAEGTRYLPVERFARTKVLQWLFFEQYYIEPTIGSLRFWTLTGRMQANAALVEGKRAGGERGLAGMERALRNAPFLAGGDFTIADLAVYAYSHLAEDAGFSLADYPNVRVWIARVADIIGSDYPVHPYGEEANP